MRCFPIQIGWRRFGLTLAQLQAALSASNANVGGDYLKQGSSVQIVRGLGLLGSGRDPVQNVLGMEDPLKASEYLREEELRRCQEIRDVGVGVDEQRAGPHRRHRRKRRSGRDGSANHDGVVVSHQTRLGRVMLDRPRTDDKGHELRHDGQRVWESDEDAVQGIVLLQKNEASLARLWTTSPPKSRNSMNPAAAGCCRA